MRYYFQLAVIVLSGLSGIVNADEEARVFLDRMSHSFRELNYQGAFSYQQGDVTQSLRITHAVINGEEFERLEHMDGERRDIIRRGHHLSCIHPGHQLIRLYQQHQNLNSSSANPNSNSQNVSDFYDISVVDNGRIAGREVVELLVRPKDTHRFIHRLSLDKQTGLLLRSIVEGSAGKILERFQFADIKIGNDISLDQFKDASYSYHASHHAPQIPNSNSSSKKSWSVSWLPGGFTAIVTDQKNATDDMVTFTDGFAVFSVFLEKMDETEKSAPNSNGEGHARRGATVAYSRPLVLADSPHRVTVVGEIPKQTAQQVAQSVSLVPPK